MGEEVVGVIMSSALSSSLEFSTAISYLHPLTHTLPLHLSAMYALYTFIDTFKLPATKARDI